MSTAAYENLDTGSTSKWERFKPSGVTIAKIWYSSFVLVGYVMALFLRDGFFGLLQHVPAIYKYTCAADQCLGFSAVYRVSFAMVIFFLIHAIMASPLCCVGDRVRLYLQYKWFILKIPLFFGLVAITFFIPNPFFVVYAWISVVFAAVFLIVQTIVLIDFAYSWNESWVAKDQKKWYAAILVCAIALFVAGLAFIIVEFVFFGSGAPCHLNRFFICITAIAGLIYTAISLKVEHGALLPSAVIFFYTCFACFSALLSYPEPDDPSKQVCNKLFTSHSTNIYTLAFGSIITLFSLMRLVLTTTPIFEDVMTGNEGSNRQDGGAGGDLDEMYGAEAEEKAEMRRECRMMLWAQITFVLASFYMAMLITSWQIRGKSAELMVDEGVYSMWAKLVSEWFTIVVYLWSLIAPFICRHRKF